MQEEENSEINNRKDARHNVIEHNILEVHCKDKHKDIWLPSG